MKELEGQSAQSPNTETVIERQIQKKKQLLGSLRMQRGHKLFGLRAGVLREIMPEEYDEIEVAKEVADKKTMVLRKKLKVDPDTYYVSALNIKNAERKLRNALS